MAGDTVFATRGGQISALDAASGAPRWTFDTGEFMATAPAILNGRIFFATKELGGTRGHLYVLE